MKDGVRMTPNLINTSRNGHCDGRKHKSGLRVATLLVYCKVPAQGGHTNFRNAGVHIKPKAGDALFFSYMDPETKVHDTFFTEHSGCPVYEGTKQLVTHWMRLGVSRKRPYYNFNTLGEYVDPDAVTEQYKQSQLQDDQMNMSDFVNPEWIEKLEKMREQDAKEFHAYHERNYNHVSASADKASSSTADNMAGDEL
mmetsp:Transcript_27560/g.57663  ORF Transcript_27560/g.57663 Transcript_27560/m.57663 type:complete len:196 (+) Transcript_27560:87-674(+)